MTDERLREAASHAADFIDTFPAVRGSRKANDIRVALRAALAATELDHALHFDPDCEECAYLARPTRETLTATPEPPTLDVERLARAYDECGFRPQLAIVEWEALAAEYARLSSEPRQVG